MLKQYIIYIKFVILYTVCVAVCTSNAWADSSSLPTPKNLSIIRVTPNGEDVRAAQQIVFEFNRAVVPVGRMDRTSDEVGVQIVPSLNCQWRWLNISSLACNLNESDAAHSATRYDIMVPPIIKAEDGASIKKTENYSFVTERPKLYETTFKTWRDPSTPVIQAIFNQPVSKSSVEKHVFFTDANGKIRRSINVYPDTDEQELPEYMWVPNEKNWIKISPDVRKVDDKKTEILGEEARRVWVIEPKKKLPLDQDISLKVEPGLVSAEGPEKGDQNSVMLSFDTFPEFKFAGISCTGNAEDKVFIEPGKTQDILCDPLRGVSLAFTAPVLRSQVKEHGVFTPDLANGRKDYNPWGDENRDNLNLDFAHEKGRLYYINIPYGLKAAQEYKLDLVSESDFKNAAGEKAKSVIEDQFGRALKKSVHIKFGTNHRNPNFEMPYNNAVLEKGIDSEIPLYVNNLVSYGLDYRLVTSEGSQVGKHIQKNVNKVEDIQYAVPMGIRDLLGGGSGAIYGKLYTKPDIIGKWHGDYKIFAQVTPWQVHVKLGHFSSLLWVTDLATGKPVKDVNVTLYKDSFLTLSSPRDIVKTAKTNESGIAFLPGTEVLDPDTSFKYSSDEDDPELFVRLDQGSDMAILPLSDDFELNLWDFASDKNTYRTIRQRYGHLKSWGMTAQGVYRAGDTIQYKVYARNQNDHTLTQPPKGDYTLEIIDPMRKKVQETKISFSDFGDYSGEYKIPEGGAVGWYDFVLKSKFPINDTKDNGSGELTDTKEEKGQSGVDTVDSESIFLEVLVSDFTPVPFRVETEIGAKIFHPKDTINIETRALLHSGGGYGDASARTTITLKEKTFSPDNPALQGVIFGSSNNGKSKEQIFEKSGILNQAGVWNEKYTIPQQSIYFGKLEVESSVQDDRGKSIASLSSADYIGVDRFVGLKSPEWFYETKKPVNLQAVVVDQEGKIIEGTDVSIVLEREDISIAKVKGAGNAYLSDITRNWKEIKTYDIKPAGLTDIIFTPDQAGTFRATATIKDSEGRTHKTQLSFWVSGENYVQWNDQDNLELPIVPEKSGYKVGDVAKFLIKNPYPGATALVTIERYGIIDHFIKKLDGSAPILEIPVKPDYMPGFYLSVVVISPRVDMPPPELGQIDMGKPAFRMGYVTVPIRDPYKEIKVDMSVAQDVYRPRDKVKVKLKAVPLNPTEEKEPIQLAITVLDDSVFDLISGGKHAFDPYERFYGLDNLDLQNYSLLYRLIGKQKFDKKGANPGGDGGANIDMRTSFKYVSYWNPAIKTDKNGEAEIEFVAPDNLTGWRIIAVATTPTDRMGVGEGKFKVNRPTELRPVMPNQVHEEDDFVAGFSVMNRTEKPRKITVTISASGDINSSGRDNRGDKKLVKLETVNLEPYKRATINIPLKAGFINSKTGRKSGNILFTATAEDNFDQDATTHSLPILQKRVIDVGATYGTTTDKKVEQKIAFPKDIYTDIGDVSVVLSPSVIANLTGAFQYMRDYPYPCWEQTLTRAVMAAHYKELKSWLPADFEWKEAESLPESMLERAANYQSPNGGMSYFIPTDEHADPYLSAYTALAFHWLKKDGYKIPLDVETRLNSYLKNFLRQDAAPDFYKPGMKSTVRAVALMALAEEGQIDSSDVKRYQPQLKEMSLFGKAHYLAAASMFDDTQDAAKQALDMILSYGNETGGKFMFSEVLDDGYVRILSTPLRDNCAILSSFMTYSQRVGAELIADKPFKLVRMITQSRGSKDYWENSQENMFCMAALVDYARVYETLKPTLSIKASLDGQSFGTANFKNFRDQPVTLSKPIAENDSGKTQNLLLDMVGEGRIYYATRLFYAPKTGWQSQVNAGMDLSREYSVKKDGSWVLLKPPMIIRRGDNVRVDLYLSLPAPRNFVVVHDPLPGGLETINRDLRTASTVDAEVAQYDDKGGSLWFQYGDWIEYNASFWSFYHRELRHDSVRFYSDWLPAGNYHLSYMTQAIADGVFAAPPAKAEEMYDPDVYGRGDNAYLTIKSD